MSPSLISTELFKSTFESPEWQCHISVNQRKEESTIHPGEGYMSVCWVVAPSGFTTFPVCSMVHRLCCSPVMLGSLLTEKGLLYRRTLGVSRVSRHLKSQIDVQVLLRGKLKKKIFQGKKENLLKEAWSCWGSIPPHLWWGTVQQKSVCSGRFLAGEGYSASAVHFPLWCVVVLGFVLVWALSMPSSGGK